MGELAAKDKVAMNGGLVHQEFPQDDRGPITAVCNSSLQIALPVGSVLYNES